MYHTIYIKRMTKMKTFQELETIKNIEHFIDKHQLTFLYFSHPNCSVCQGLLPQVQQMMNNYPNIQLGHINTRKTPEVAGYFSVFTVPVLLLFVNGKEYIRKARIVHMNLLEEEIKKFSVLFTVYYPSYFRNKLLVFFSSLIFNE